MVQSLKYCRLSKSREAPRQLQLLLVSSKAVAALLLVLPPKS